MKPILPTVQHGGCTNVRLERGKVEEEEQEAVRGAPYLLLLHKGTRRV